MKEELINRMIKYIEYTEIVLDGEFGSNMNLEELIKEDKMPEIYNDLIAFKISQNNKT